MSGTGPAEEPVMTGAIRVGRRVVVRFRLPEGGLTDALGELLAAPDPLVVRTSRGDVAVPADAVVAAKEVPPRASRRGPAHLSLSVADLERVMALHWVAPDREDLGDWLLRAAGGFTGRGNSVLAVGDPHRPLPDALDAVRAWYPARGLPPIAAVPVAAWDPAPVAGPPALLDPDAAVLAADDLPDGQDAAALRAAFAEQGWVPGGGVSAYAMTAPTAELRVPPAGLPDGLVLDLADTPDEGWLATYRYRGQDLPPHALDLLLSCERQVFVSIRDLAGRTAAVARGSVAGGWAGVTAVDVAPEYRRQGLARVLLAAIARWAWDLGAGSTFLQTAAANGPAHALYLTSGFVVHHRYDYLTPG